MSAPKSNLGVQAAHASWVAPLLTVVCNAFARGSQVDPGTARMISLGASAFVLIGLIAAIFALASIPKYGSRAILVPAVFGLALNLAFVALLVMAISLLANRA